MTRILAKPNKEVDKSGKSTKNIVYRDVLRDEGGALFHYLFAHMNMLIYLKLLLHLTLIVFHLQAKLMRRSSG